MNSFTCICVIFQIYPLLSLVCLTASVISIRLSIFDQNLENCLLQYNAYHVDTICGAEQGDTFLLPGSLLSELQHMFQSSPAFHAAL